jgi:copper chaperone
MIKLKIEGMTCGHCVTHVKQALAAVPGVAGPVEVTLAGDAQVPGSADPAALIAAVVEEGYSAVEA